MIEIKKACPNCKKKVVALWKQLQGIRIVVTGEDGKECYDAKCPECGHTWAVQK